VLTDRVIPNFLTKMLKYDKIEAENVLLAVDMFKFYQDLPESLKDALVKKQKSFLNLDTKESKEEKDVEE